MKAMVAGGWDYTLTPKDYAFLERTVRQLRVTEIYTDGLPGVPEQVERWGRQRALPVHRVTANFMHDGPATPEERNTSLVALARIVIVFPGGNEDLLAKARAARRQVVESPTRNPAEPARLSANARPSTAKKTKRKLSP